MAATAGDLAQAPRRVRGSSAQSSRRSSAMSESIGYLLERNRAWSLAQIEEDADYFARLERIQQPEYLWIGCSDSRVPANTIIGLDPGEVFVHRNVGNQAIHSDMNGMSCLEYAVQELKVKTIMVTGHYNCGAVRAALRLPSKTPGLVNCWISDIRHCRNEHQEELQALDDEAQVNRLSELNVMRQTFHVCTSPTVQRAWDSGQDLEVYGLIYALRDGKLKRLVGPLRGTQDVGEDLTAFESVHAWSEEEAAEAGRLGSGKLGQMLQAASLTSDGSALETPEEVAEQLLNTAHLNNKLVQHVAWSEPRRDSAPSSSPRNGAAAMVQSVPA